MKFSRNLVFQAYAEQNIKLVASRRRSSNIVPKMVLFLKIYKKKKIYFFI